MSIFKKTTDVKDPVDASSYLYMSLRPSDGRLVGWLDGPRPVFLNAENEQFSL